MRRGKILRFAIDHHGVFVHYRATTTNDEAVA